MNLTNYHSHCIYCDGRASMEEFVHFAIANRFSSYGFSSHAPLPFSTAWSMEWELMPQYLDEFRRLRSKHADQIELYIGLEIDYLGEESGPSLSKFRELPLDYRIGSVHLLPSPQGGLVDIDVTPERYRDLVDKYWNGDIEHVVRLYYARLTEMLHAGGFDIVGHADKMHYNANCYRPGLIEEPWYDELVRAYFAEITACGYQIEINTKAYEDIGVFFPNARYFEYLRQLGARVQVNSDAHYPDRINCGRLQALKALQAAGFTHVMELRGGSWEERAITL